MTRVLRKMIVRRGDKYDVRSGLGDVLRRLSPHSPDESMIEHFARGADYPVWVVEGTFGDPSEDDCNWEVIGTVAAFMEQKLTHDGGLVAHLEDLVVCREFEGYGIARMLIDHVKEWAVSEGCYKVVLSCSEEKRGLYEKCGFRQNEISMRCDL